MKTIGMAQIRANLVAIACWAWIAAATLAGGGLELRQWTANGVTSAGQPIPPEAVRVFVHEGQPASVHVTGQYIAVDYGRSGVLFDRADGQIVRRLTVADCWPRVRPEVFGQTSRQRHELRTVGPGVLNPWYRPPAARPLMLPGPGMPGRSSRHGRREEKEKPLPPTPVVETQFDGATWRAVQPARFLQTVKGHKAPDRRVAWSDILARLSEACYVEADPGDGQPPKRFTTADGLAGNIVTHLVAHGDALWAACVDIYDPKAEKWGPGGLCRYDKKTGRWQRIEQIAGRPVRWVTLLQAVGDELWVGFREGKGVVGDKVAFGMGLYPGIYRPKASAIVLARLSGGEWTSFARAPRPENDRRNRSTADPKTITPPTEYPVELARVDDKVLLFSRANAHQSSGNWDIKLAGHVSLLDIASSKWRLFDPEKDLDADQLMDMEATRGEVLVSSNRGVHRFDPETATWRFLDPNCPLRNPVFHTAAIVGDELWLGYARQSFGTWGTQGISRFDEKTGQWHYMSPAELGTASPVRRIVSLDNGEVWVLFGDRPYMGAAMRWDFYPREHIPRSTGLGRFAGGTWEFPVEGPSVTNDNQWGFFGQSDDLAAVGNRLIYATRSGVYAGPKSWKRLAEGWVIKIAPSPDGKSVEIIRRDPDSLRKDQPINHPRELQWARVGPADDHAQFQDMEAKRGEEINTRGLIGGDSLIASYPGAGQHWVHVPLAETDDWVVGDFLDSHCHGVLESPAAVWIFSQGEILRLDRNTLTDLAKESPEKE